MVLGVGMRAVMLEFWVDLGEEMEVICWVLDALVLVEWKRRKRAVFAEEEGGELVASATLKALSLGRRKKAVKEEIARGFIRSWGWRRARWDFEIPPA